ILAWYMDRVFPVGRRVNKVVSPILSKVSGLPVAGDQVFGSAQSFYDRLEGIQDVLTDPEMTSVRLVVNPEKMVIAEARRTYTYLSLFGYQVDAVVANRLLPDDVTDPWFDRWRALQAEHLETIHDGFAPLPVLSVDLADQEVVGFERLRALAAEAYGDEDPSARLHEGAPLQVESLDDGRTTLVLPLPFASKDEIDLGRNGDELLVRVGAYRRVVLLPDSLRRRKVDAATLRGGSLRVTFSAPVSTSRAHRTRPSRAGAPR
ncbi:MAG TPA: ArsA-related P-loop ATPase, partial [Acidimicrobiales bacterium]|nr:ArsA-related P-loop ATPase [Acidimicrobiales bacterium]